MRTILAGSVAGAAALDRGAFATLSYGFSQANSGEWTPTIVNPSFSYRPCQSRNCGITFLLLYQP